MKNRKKMLLIPLIIGVACLYWISSQGQLKKFINVASGDNVKVVKWDNDYQGDNIEIYYLNLNNENVRKFGDANNLKSLKADNESEEYVSNVIKWISSNITYKKNAVYQGSELYEVKLHQDKKTLMNDEEITSVFNHALAYGGIYSRTAYIIGDVNQERENYIYRINEYWNMEQEKWIAVDSVNGVAFFEEGKMLSGIELFTSDRSKVVMKSLTGEKLPVDYKKELFDYNYAYAISIDNNKYGRGLINASITYTDEEPFLTVRQAFYNPSIFVKDTKLFEKIPGGEFVNNFGDEEPTMIFGKSISENEEDKNVYIAVGVMFNSRMINDYYYSVNGSDWLKVERDFHFFFKMKDGENRIKISSDGVMTDREVVLEYEKK